VSHIAKSLSHMGIERVHEFIMQIVVDTLHIHTHIHTYTQDDIYTHNRGALIGDLTYCKVVSHMAIERVHEFILQIVVDTLHPHTHILISKHTALVH